MRSPRRIVLVAFPGVQVLDVTGPLEVFAMANRQAPPERPHYRLEVVAPRSGPMRTSNGLAIVVDRSVGETTGRIDTLVVAGGQGTTDATRDDELIGWLRRAAGRSRRITSVCSGAFLLACAGLLDGRRAVTHWSACDLLESRFPAVRVERDPIFVRDGDVWTSAGVTAGMDLALALVEDDLGREAALEVARWLVLFLKRPGGQSQFSVQLAAQVAEREPLRDLQAWVGDHLADDLSVPALARRASMSTRNFARSFRREVGTTPGDYVESLRLETARRQLESTTRSVEAIARDCGFGTAETMHRAFRRRLGVSPGAYRRHFRQPVPSSIGAPA